MRLAKKPDFSKPPQIDEEKELASSLYLPRRHWKLVWANILAVIIFDSLLHVVVGAGGSNLHVAPSVLDGAYGVLLIVAALFFNGSDARAKEMKRGLLVSGVLVWLTGYAMTALYLLFP